jgi:hypothetical protein
MGTLSSIPLHIFIKGKIADDSELFENELKPLFVSLF